MAVEVIMPKVDMDQETGTVGQWVKKDGDEVKQGETILEIETDKVAIEVEAPASGILRGILVEEGETVPIATTIAYILQPGEALPTGARPVVEEKPAPPPVQRTDWEVPVTPVARKMAAAEGLDLSTVEGSGPQGRITKKDVQDALTAPVPFGNGEGKVYATPAARRIAGERGINLKAVQGSGPDGRIQAADVEAAAHRLAERVAAPSVPSEPAAVPSPDVEVVPLRGMRRTIAERMTASYQQTPHISFSWRSDMTAFNQARAQLNAQAEKAGGPRISATALLVKIVATVLTRHPWLNASFQEEEIHLYRDVNIGVAVALDTGLIVPVIRDAANKGLAEIAGQVKDLSQRARTGDLVPSEVKGGTFTISNLGPFGVEQFSAIINPPEAAILAVGATRDELVPGENGAPEVRPLMSTTLSADHRVVDGAVAAHFIADLKEALQAPILLLM